MVIQEREFTNNDHTLILYLLKVEKKQKNTFFLSGLFFINVHDSQDSRGRRSLSL